MPSWSPSLCVGTSGLALQVHSFPLAVTLDSWYQPNSCGSQHTGQANMLNLPLVILCAYLASEIDAAIQTDNTEIASSSCASSSHTPCLVGKETPPWEGACKSKSQSSFVAEAVGYRGACAVTSSATLLLLNSCISGWGWGDRRACLSKSKAV